MTSHLDPKSLEQLFATQGYKLTDEQLDALIAHFRAERARIAAAEAAGKPIRKPASASPPSAAPTFEELMKDL